MRSARAAVAGQTAGEKIRQVFTLPMESVGMGVATYAGQNDGAGRYDRIRQGLRAGLTIQWTYCAAAWVVLFFGKGPFTALVLGAGETQVAAYSVQYLSIISVLFCLHGALMVFRNTLQGMGYSLHAVLSGVGELAGRAVGSALAVASLGFAGICLANPIAWGLALGYCVVMVRHYLRRREAARAAFQLTFPSYCKSEEEAGVCLPPLRFLQRKRFAQHFKRSVLVLLAHQQ